MMYPDAASLMELCKCGNDQCGRDKFCFNKDETKNGGDAGSVCLDVI